MENDLDQAARELTAALEDAALYNDKGSQWSTHSPAQKQQEQARFQAALEALAARIGKDKLAPALWDAIASGAAARDVSGDVANLARRTLQANNRG